MTSGEPAAVPDPTFAAEAQRDLGAILGSGPAGSALRQSVDRMSAIGPDAETAYQEAIAGVRSQPPDELRAAVTAAFRDLPDDAYLDRVSMVQVLTDVRDPSLVDVLRDVIAAPLPPERSTGEDYKYSTTAREVLIRTTAVDGVARLAAEGSAEAVDVLVDNVTHENHTVRAACVVALLELGGEPASRARDRIRDDDRDLLELRRARVQDVPQPDPGSEVRYPGAYDAPAPPPNPDR
jgi:hypothetical protein